MWWCNRRSCKKVTALHVTEYCQACGELQTPGLQIQLMRKVRVCITDTTGAKALSDPPQGLPDTDLRNANTMQACTLLIQACVMWKQHAIMCNDKEKQCALATRRHEWADIWKYKSKPWRAGHNFAECCPRRSDPALPYFPTASALLAAFSRPSVSSEG